MEDLLKFSEGTLQEVALVIMALVYALRIYWLFRFKRGRDRQPQTGAVESTPQGGAAYSLAVIAMPWTMESSRSKPFLYAQFVIFHIGVVAAIGLSFVIPYLPGLLEHVAVVRIIQVLTGAAFLVAVMRIYRRLTKLHVRSISSLDDHFSLGLLTVWFLFATLAAPNNRPEQNIILITFFLLTAFFLIYVPFSKISHYLYYPFTRYWLGRTMGHRGVYPASRKP